MLPISAELIFEGHRIHGCAVPSAEAGEFLAAAVALRLGEHGLPVEVVFRDDELDDGRLFSDPVAALSFALEVGRAAVSNQAFFAALGLGCDDAAAR